MINRRKILLTSELGDWTSYVPDYDSKDTKVGNVGISKFDRLSRKEFVKGHSIHYEFLEKLSAEIIKKFNIKVDLFSVEAIQTVYKNFPQLLEGNYFQASMKIDDKYSFWIYIQDALANALVDRSLGGKGQATEEQLGRIEKKILEKIMDPVILSYADFMNMDKSKINLIDVQDRITDDLSMNPQSSYIMFSGKLTIGNNKPGKIIFGYGREAILELVRRNERPGSKTNLKNVELLKTTQKKTKVKIAVNIGHAEISMKDLMSLSEGDVIRLDTPVNSLIKADLANELIFTCFPGVVNKNYGVQIVGKHNQFEEEISDNNHREVILIDHDKAKECIRNDDPGEALSEAVVGTEETGNNDFSWDIDESANDSQIM